MLDARLGKVVVPLAQMMNNELLRLSLPFNAVCVAVEIGLFASDVLLTLPRPTSLDVSVTAPVRPATDVTGAAPATADELKDPSAL
jgi:hypothetical protein